MSWDWAIGGSTTKWLAYRLEGLQRKLMPFAMASFIAGCARSAPRTLGTDAASGARAIYGAPRRSKSLGVRCTQLQSVCEPRQLGN